MSNYLEKLLISRVRIDKNEDQEVQKVLTDILSNLIRLMKEKSPEFSQLYREKYYGGSYYDGLKVGSTDHEFDLNIVFQWPDTNIQVANLGSDKRKPNFANLQILQQNLTPCQKEIVGENSLGQQIISPKRLFKILQTAVDKSMTDLSSNIRDYRVTRVVGAPVTLLVEGQRIKFSVDLVPSFKLELSKLSKWTQLVKRVEKLTDKFDINCTTCMAIALHKASGDMFEIDFHDVERGILKDRGCVKNVIKYIKFLRDSTGGTASKLWSHLIKTSVMHLVLREDHLYWNNKNVEICFVDCLRNIQVGLAEGCISDLFFPEFNMLKRLDESIISQNSSWLDKLIKKYERESNLSVFFTFEGSKGKNAIVTSDNETVPEPPKNTYLATVFKSLFISSNQTTLSESSGTKSSIRNCSGDLLRSQEEGKAVTSSYVFKACDICGIKATSQAVWEAHIKSNKHINKSKPVSPNQTSLTVTNGTKSKSPNESSDVLRSQEEVKLATSSNVFKSCDICGIKATSQAVWEAHLKSNKHINKSKPVSSNHTSLTLTNGTKSKSQNESSDVVRSQEEVKLATSSNVFKSCDICGIKATTQAVWEDHLKSEKHTNKTKYVEVNTLHRRQTDRVNSQSFECEICQISTTDKAGLELHKKGQKHLSKLLTPKDKSKSTDQIKQGPIKCNVCNISVSSLSEMENHLEGQKHKKKINQA